MIVTDPYKEPPFGSIVFASDLLKIDDRASNRFTNPQGINVRWLHGLFSEYLRPHARGIECLVGDEGREESIRWKVLDTMQLPLESHSWASIYFDTYEVPTLLCACLDDRYRDALWITFEAPPYLVTALNALGVPFIDLAIHPVRFLPDYMFGFRTNSATIRRRLNSFRIPDDTIEAFARISSARTTRVFRTKYPPDSAIFFGQLTVDASLIHANGIATLEEVRSSLVNLKLTHDKVYYKAHPHLSDTKEVRDLVASIPGCEWIDVNAYDAIGSTAFSTIGTLSSSVGTEAFYFGRSVRRFLDRPDYFDPTATDDMTYIPVYGAPVYRGFWNSILTGVAFENAFLPTPHVDALRFSLNMKWGR